MSTARAVASALCLSLVAAPALGAEAEKKAPAYVPGSVWAALNGKEQKDVVQELVKELVEVRSGHATAVEAATKRGKSLDELIEDQIKSDTEAKASGYLAKKYAKDYAVMAAEYLAKNAVKLQELAGEISAGKYDGAQSFVASTGGQAFGKLVSDYLKELKYTDSQYVWDTVVANVESFRKVFIEIARGDTAKALEVFQEEAKKKGKELGKKAVEQAINLVFSEVTNVNLGKVYVALVEAEIEAIEIAKRWMRREYVEPCLDLYVEKYLFYAGESNRTAPGPFDIDSQRLWNAANSAYYAPDAESFEECATKGRVAQEFREFEVVITEAGIRPETIYLPMLEAYRRHYTMPADWFEQEVVGARKEAQKVVATGLGRASGDLLSVSQGFMGAVQIRLNQLAWEKLQDSQKKELEQKLAAALETARPAWTRAQQLRDGIVGACKDYDAARNTAADALARTGAARTELTRISSAIELLPRCAAEDDMAARAVQLRRDARSQRANYERLLDEMKGHVAAACTAADGVKSAATKEASREELDRATAAAEEARVSISGAQQELERLRQTREASAALARSLAATPDTPAGASRGEKIAALDQRLAKVEAEIPDIKSDFDGAKNTMWLKYKRANVLIDVLGEKLKEVIDALAPYGDAPDEMTGAAETKRILAAARREEAEGAASCAYGVRASWEKGDDESNLGAGRLAWSRQEVDFSPAPESLAERLKAAIDACPGTAESAALGDPFGDIETVLSGAEDQSVLLDIARQGYEECVQKAIVAYNDGWLQPLKVPPLEGLAEAAARARLAELKLAAAVEPGDPAGKISEAGTVQAQSPAPGTPAERGEVVTLKIFGAIDESAIAAAAADAETALRACDMARADALIDDLPPDYARRTQLEALKNSLIEQEKSARDAYAAGRELYRARELDQALSKMRDARGGAVCPKTVAAIDDAIARIEERLAAVEADRVRQAEAALQACRLEEAAALIRGLPEGGSDRARLVARYKGEAVARRTYQAGRDDYRNGAYDQALARFREARGMALCESTIAAIDAAIAQTGSRVADATREVEQQAAAAVRACEMERARNLIASLPADDPGRRRVEAMLEREAQARSRARQAGEALRAERYESAANGFRLARSDAICDKTIAAIDRYLDEISRRQAEDQRTVAALARDGEAALANCDFDRARGILAQLPPDSDAYRRLRALADRQNEAMSYFPEAQAAYQARDYQGALNAMYEARRLAVCNQTRVNAESNIARIRDAQREADNLAADEERRRQEEAARQEAEAARVMGEIFSTLGQTLGGGATGYGGAYPPSGGGTYGGGSTYGGGGTYGGAEDPRCVGFRSEAESHSARLQIIYRNYVAAGRANDRARLQYYACELLKEQKRGYDLTERYRRQGCPIPSSAVNYQPQFDASRAQNCR